MLWGARPQIAVEYADGVDSTARVIVMLHNTPDGWPHWEGEVIGGPSAHHALVETETEHLPSFVMPSTKLTAWLAAVSNPSTQQSCVLKTGDATPDQFSKTSVVLRARLPESLAALPEGTLPAQCLGAAYVAFDECDYDDLVDSPYSKYMHIVVRNHTNLA